MANVMWAHLCDHAFFDENKKACLIGIFQVIHTPKVPAIHPWSVFSFHIKGEHKEKIKIRIQVIRPDGRDPLIDDEISEIVIPENGEINSNFGLVNLQLPDYGPYDIKVYLNDELSHEHKFFVNKIQ